MYDEQEKQAKEQRRKEAERRSDIRWLMSTARGRRIMWGILSQCGTFARSIDTNALIMASHEGRRSIGASLFGIIMQACPEQYITMTTENTNQKSENEGEINDN